MALLVAAPAHAAFTPKLKRKLALVVKNNMTDRRCDLVTPRRLRGGRQAGDVERAFRERQPQR